jgi:hypothetical protein
VVEWTPILRRRHLTRTNQLASSTTLTGRPAATTTAGTTAAEPHRQAATLLHVFSSADLGGFHGTTAEAYVRWLQFGAFSPIFRTYVRSVAGSLYFRSDSYKCKTLVLLLTGRPLCGGDDGRI